MSGKEEEMLKAPSEDETELIQVSTGLSNELRLDDILAQLGKPGLYHVISYFILLSCMAFTCNHHATISSTIGITPENYHCKRSFAYHKALEIPLNTSLDHLLFSKCHVSLKVNGSRKIKCHKWTYEAGNEGTIDTIVTKWNLVCDLKYIPQLSNSLYFVGLMLGGLTLSHLADKYGRRRVLLPFMLLSILTSVATALSPYLILFMILRLILGIFVSVVHSVTHVLITEIAPKKYKNIVTLALISSFLGGIVFGGVVAWWFKVWWKAHIFIAAPLLFPLIAAYFFLPESFRWLMVHKRHALLQHYLDQAARINNVKIPAFGGHLQNGDIMVNKQGEHDENKKKHIPFMSLFKHKEMRRRLLSMFFVWNAIAMAYYAMSMNIKNISTNPYMAFIVGAAADLLPLFLSFFTLFRFGKRRLLYVYMMLGGLLSISYKFYNHIGIMIAGKMFTGINFGLVYFFTIDLVPTVARNLCLGACGTVSRIGSLLAPQLVLLGAYTSPDIPVLISGILLIIASILIYYSPEASNNPLPASIDDVENYKDIKRKLKEDTKEEIEMLNDKA